MRHTVRAVPSRSGRRRPSPVEYGLLLGAILLVVVLVVLEFGRYVKTAYDPPCTKAQVVSSSCTITSGITSAP